MPNAWLLRKHSLKGFEEWQNLSEENNFVSDGSGGKSDEVLSDVIFQNQSYGRNSYYISSV